MNLSTNELAELIRCKPESIRVRLCREGSYYGVRPSKLPNGRLLWPADTVEKLQNTKVTHERICS